MCFPSINIAVFEHPAERRIGAVSYYLTFSAIQIQSMPDPGEPIMTLAAIVKTSLKGVIFHNDSGTLWTTIRDG